VVDGVLPPSLNRQNSGGSRGSLNSVDLYNNDFEKTPRSLEKMSHKFSTTPHTFERTPHSFTPGSQLTPSTIGRSFLMSPSDTPGKMAELYKGVDDFMRSPKSPDVPFIPRNMKSKKKGDPNATMGAPMNRVVTTTQQPPQPDPPKNPAVPLGGKTPQVSRDELLKMNRARCKAGVQPWPVPPAEQASTDDDDSKQNTRVKSQANEQESGGSETNRQQEGGSASSHGRRHSSWEMNSQGSDSKEEVSMAASTVDFSRHPNYPSDSDNYTVEHERRRQYALAGEYPHSGPRHLEQGRGFRHHSIYNSHRTPYGGQRSHVLAFEQDDEGRRGLEMRDSYEHRQPRRGTGRDFARHHPIVEFGHPREVMEGDNIYSRHTLFLWGAHKSEISPVNGTALLGCDSLMFTGEEAEEPKHRDEIEIFKYQCSQRNGGGALYRNYTDQLPLRVFRKTKGENGVSGFRYDGLYTVIAMFDDSGKPRSELSTKSKLLSFLLKRNPASGRTRYSNRMMLNEVWDVIQESKDNSRRPRGGGGGGGGRSNNLHVPQLSHGDGRGHSGGMNHGLGVAGNLGAGGLSGPNSITQPLTLPNAISGKSLPTRADNLGGHASPMHITPSSLPGGGIGPLTPNQAPAPPVSNTMSMPPNAGFMTGYPFGGLGGMMSHTGGLGPSGFYGGMIPGYPGGLPGYVASTPAGKMFGFPGGGLGYHRNPMDPKAALMGIRGPMPCFETSSPLPLKDRSRTPFNDAIASGEKKLEKGDKTKINAGNKTNLIGAKTVLSPLDVLSRNHSGLNNGGPHIPSADSTYGMRSPNGSLRPMSVGFGEVVQATMGAANLGYMPYQRNMGPPMNWNGQQMKRS